MLNAIIVVLKCTSCVVWRTDVNTLQLPGVFLFERLEAKQIVPPDEHVVENILLRDPVRRMMRVLRHLQQNTRLQPRPVLLANPGEFEFLFFGGHEMI